MVKNSIVLLPVDKFPSYSADPAPVKILTSYLDGVSASGHRRKKTDAGSLLDREDKRSSWGTALPWMFGRRGVGRKCMVLWIVFPFLESL